MFTGIIESTGQVAALTPIEGDVRLHITAPQLDFTDVALGDSIASNGICLTVVDLKEDSYAVDVSRETLKKTALHTLNVGDTVNLEKAMLPTTRFGGHMVAGHVDGVGEITYRQRDARSIYFEVTIPEALSRYVTDKGSITVDGISLTTNMVKDNVVCLNIIPHTAQVTNIDQHWHMGGLVNIEVDVVARYLERLLQTHGDLGQTNVTKSDSIDRDLLEKNGYMADNQRTK